MKKKVIISCIVIIIVMIGLTVFLNEHLNQPAETIGNYPTDNNMNEGNDTMKLYIKIGNKILTATLASNSSAEALVKKLKGEDLTIEMSDYAHFEKVGLLGFHLPTNDTEFTTESGDIILYQGNQITIYYDTNHWKFTKIGKIDDISKTELKQILGSGDVIITFSLKP